MEQFDMLKFAELNTATKYPSIETYHVLGDRGGLTEDVGTFAGAHPRETVYATEKIDGTNGRIVFLPGGDYFIGSRENLLYARGDRVKSPTLSIVDTLLPVAESLVEDSYFMATASISVLYFEVYGGKIGAEAKQYSKTGFVSHRLFDHAYIGTAILDWDREAISSWRDHGGQTFAEVAQLESFAKEYSLQTVPYVDATPSADLPTDVQGMSNYLLANFADSQARLDQESLGKSEGIVFRTADRGRIAKARFQDYARTLKRRK